MGRIMIMISDSVARKLVEDAPESVCSARQAVVDVGFDYFLGEDNMQYGTDLHRQVIKNELYSNQEETLRDVLKLGALALNQETAVDNTQGVVKVADLFDLSRRVTLRFMIGQLISPLLVEAQLIDAFMKFETDLEEAVKATVLPRFLALPLALWPMQRKRIALQATMATLIDAARIEESSLGPWLRHLKSHSSHKASEYCIGLLFAAHKNAAIGVSQAFCFLQEATNTQTRLRAKQEAAAFLSGAAKKDRTVTDCLAKATTLRHCVLETMRVCGHTIGGVRTAKKDFELKASGDRSYHIREGDILALSHNLPHWDKQVWGANADVFDLERWSKTEAAHQLTTFSGGVHICPGRRLAIQYMQCMLALWLERDIELLVGPMPAICFERATLAQRKGRVAVQMKQK